MVAEEVKKGKGQWKFQGWCFCCPSSYIYEWFYTGDMGSRWKLVEIRMVYKEKAYIYTSKKKKKETNTDAYRMVESKSDSFG